MKAAFGCLAAALLLTSCGVRDPQGHEVRAGEAARVSDSGVEISPASPADLAALKETHEALIPGLPPAGVVEVVRSAGRQADAAYRDNVLQVRSGRTPRGDSPRQWEVVLFHKTGERPPVEIRVDQDGGVSAPMTLSAPAPTSADPQAVDLNRIRISAEEAMRAGERHLGEEAAFLLLRLEFRDQVPVWVVQGLRADETSAGEMVLSAESGAVMESPGRKSP